MPFFYAVAMVTGIVGPLMLLYWIVMEAGERKEPERWPGEREYRKRLDDEVSARYVMGHSTWAPKGRM